MRLAMVGLGKMGSNMTARLLQGGHQVVGYDLNAEALQRVQSAGAETVSTVEEIPAKLTPPRVVWVMVPAGAPTENTIDTLGRLLSSEDIVVDGGNSNYKDSMRRAAALKQLGIHFVDAGVSGGVWGLEEGYCMMIGGDREVVEELQPIFQTLAPAPDKGWGYVGPAGAGHFVKMIHNSIEYGMMEAYAEGFELLQHKHELNLDPHQIAEIWRFGSVIRSWLLDLTAAALAENPTLSGIADYVPDSGEGRWTVEEAVEMGCAIPVITLALQRRFRSQEQSPFADRLLAVLRHQFGGHEVKHTP